MKQLLLLNIILAALSTPAHSATIEAFANNVITTYNNFSSTAGGPALANNGEIEAILANDPATAIFGASSPYSAIDLGFGSNTAVTGTGADLVIFSLWYGSDYIFGLEAYGTDPSAGPLSSYKYMVTGNSIFQTCAITDSAGGCAADISAISIDLFNNDTIAAALGDNIELGYIRLFIGGDTYNGNVGGLDAYSNFSLVGANYTAAVVPLPLSVVLFSSGLALLGLTGRRKTLQR